MEIIFSGFEGTNIEQARKPFEDIINQLSQGRELKSLKYIIIPEDFKTKLYEFQRSKGLRQEFTENELGVACGKTMSYIEAGELETCIFLNSSILGLLFSEDSSNVLDAIQTLNHELCHVQDDYLKSKIFEADFIAGKEKDFDWALKLHANAIWSEYIANKTSKKVINISGAEINLPPGESLAQDSKLLFDSILGVEAAAQKSIDTYRSDRLIEKLYLEIQEISGFLLMMMARAYGSLSPYGNLIEILDDGLKETYAFDIWRHLNQSLDALNSRYPNWSGIQEFDELSQVVLKTWNILGIYPRVVGSRLYIDVPFN